MSGELTSCERMEKSLRRTARKSSFSSSTRKKSQKMAKLKKRALEGAWPLIDMRCGDLDLVFLSDCVHVSFRLSIYVRSHIVPQFDSLLTRSMFFCFLFLALSGEYGQSFPWRSSDATSFYELYESNFSFFYLFLFYSIASFFPFLLLPFFSLFPSSQSSP